MRRYSIAINSLQFLNFILHELYVPLNCFVLSINIYAHPVLPSISY